jgi:hypothetical protein
MDKETGIYKGHEDPKGNSTHISILDVRIVSKSEWYYKRINNYANSIKYANEGI